MKRHDPLRLHLKIDCREIRRRTAKRRSASGRKKQSVRTAGRNCWPREHRRRMIMASNKNLVPEAKEAMNRFKMEAASEVGVNLAQGYNGDLTSRQAGSVGGQMVKKMIESYENSIKTTK
jgi:hypothetical protein